MRVADAILGSNAHSTHPRSEQSIVLELESRLVLAYLMQERADW